MLQYVSGSPDHEKITANEKAWFSVISSQVKQYKYSGETE